MAANDILIEYGTQIAFTHDGVTGGDYNPADTGTEYTIGTPIDVAMTFSALADADAVQSDNFDFGAKRSPLYGCWGSGDYTGETPGAGTIDYYLAPSSHTTPGIGNIAGSSGANAKFSAASFGVTETGMTLAEYLSRLVFIGSLITTDSTTVQAGFVGYLVTPPRHGQLVVVNNGGDAFEADNVEMAAFLNPINPEVA